MMVRTFTRAYIVNQNLLNQATYNQSEYTYTTFPIEVPNKENHHLLVTNNLDVYDPLENNPDTYVETFLKIGQSSDNINGTFVTVAVTDISYSPDGFDIEYYDDGGYGYVLGISSSDYVPEEFPLGEETTKPILNAIRNNIKPFMTHVNNHVSDTVEDVKRQLGILVD